MYDKLRKMYPVFPTSLSESISQLKLLENNCCLFNGDQFVFVPENDEFVCITTKENLNIFWNYVNNFLLQLSMFKNCIWILNLELMKMQKKYFRK